jgi:hypothetical protein
VYRRHLQRLYGQTKVTELRVSSDEDVNCFFGEVANDLTETFGYSATEAAEMAASYYAQFTSDEFCRSIGIPLQDDEFFFHEAAGGVALRAHYYLGIKGNPDPGAFIEWRAKRYRDLRSG